MISKYNEEVNKNASLKRGTTSSNNNVVAAGGTTSSTSKRKLIVKGANSQMGDNNCSSAEVSKENNKMIDQEEIKGTYLDREELPAATVMPRQKSSNSSSPRHLHSTSIQEFEEDDPYGTT
jgi:hypothetical protein